ncbi:hypothetical protein [Streptomyces sp. NPDC002851]
MGTLQLQDRDGRLVLSLRVDDWLPEASGLHGAYPDGLALLHRSGLAEVLDVCRIPLETVRDPQHPSLDRVSWFAAARTHLAPGKLMPRWYLYTRRVALTLWAVTMSLTILTDGSVLWMPTVMGASSALWALNYVVLCLWSRWRDRRTRPEYETRISPAPAPETDATVRFVSTAAVCVQDDDIVLVSGTGEERWLSRSGPHAVTDLVRVLEHGRPRYVELRGVEGVVRSVLPWDAWFGGPGGPERWRSLVATAGLPSRSEEIDNGAKRKSQRQTEATKARDTLRFADSFYLAPYSPKNARKYTRIPEGPHRVFGERIIQWPMAGFAFGYGQALVRDGEPALGWPTLVLSGVTLLVIIPNAARQLASRLWLDRPARIPSQESA